MMQSKAHVLVVDDDPGIRRQIGDRLASRGHRVDEASTGAIALDMFRRESPDLAILDLHLPDTNGRKRIAKVADIGLTRPIQPEQTDDIKSCPSL